MSADAGAVCRAEYGVRSPERTDVRNGYRQEARRPRRHLEVAIPELRSGSYIPDRLPERRRRAERA